MVSGLFLLLACVALAVVVFWVVANERAGVDEPTHGLLALPQDEAAAQAPDEADRDGAGPGKPADGGAARRR